MVCNGSCGEKQMDASFYGFKNKAEAQKWAKSQDKVDDAARGEIGGV